MWKGDVTKGSPWRPCMALWNPALHCAKEGLYMARILVQAEQKALVEIINVSKTPGASCIAVMWTVPTNSLDPPTQKTLGGVCEWLQGVWSGVRLNLNTRGAQKLEEFITGFQDIFTMKSDDCGQTDSLPLHWHICCHLIGQPSWQTPTGQAGWGELGAEGHKKNESVHGLCPSCLSGRWIETFISPWSTGSWISPRRTACCHQWLRTHWTCLLKPSGSHPCTERLATWQVTLHPDYEEKGSRGCSSLCLCPLASAVFQQCSKNWWCESCSALLTKCALCTWMMLSLSAWHSRNSFTTYRRSSRGSKKPIWSLSPQHCWTSNCYSCPWTGEM